MKIGIYISFYIRKFLHDCVVFLVPHSLLLKMTACKEVVDHANDIDKSKYSASKRMGIFLHKCFCQCCWIYEKQLLALRKGATKVDAADMRDHLAKSGPSIMKMCSHVIEEESRKEA